MTPEEKQVIDEFEGSALEYEKTLAERIITCAEQAILLQ